MVKMTEKIVEKKDLHYQAGYMKGILWNIKNITASYEDPIMITKQVQYHLSRLERELGEDFLE